MLEVKHFWEIHVLVCISTSSLSWLVSENPGARAAHVGEGRTQPQGGYWVADTQPKICVSVP